MQTTIFPWPTSLLQRLAFAFMLCIAAGLWKTSWAYLSPIGFILAVAIMLRGSGARFRSTRFGRR